jgi:Ca-activated chloride channel family protein
LETLVEEIGTLQKQEFGNKAFTDYEDRFQYFLGFAALILIIELLTSERKNKRLLRLNPLNRKEEQA